ncbi:MAG: hypothetical protein CMH54_00465 [Myxococcales bacterium]|nr:hypothetical protein [Myxococcales bacterium]
MADVISHGDIGLATLLAFVRFSAFFLIAPIPGNGAPPTARVALAAGVAWAMAPGSASSMVGVSLVGAAVVEIVIGLAMGFMLTMVINAFLMGGEAVGHQMGLSSPSFIDPRLPGQYTVMGGAFFFLTLAIFALSGGPGRMLVLLYRSLEFVPPGGPFAPPNVLEMAQVSGSVMFLTAVQAAAPMIASVFAAQMLLAVLARAVPTMNLFIEGPGLTVAAGVIGLIASVHTFAPLVDAVFIERMENLARWLLM